MRNSQKSLGVVIPVYNKQDTIERTIISVLNQQSQFNSILVIDDGSLDNSLDIIKSFNEIEYYNYLSIKNGGVSRARNMGLEILRKQVDYILFLDADDELLPNFTSSILKSIPEERLVSVYRKRPNNNDPVFQSKKCFLTRDEILKNWSRFSSPIWTGCTMVKTEGLKSIFDPYFSHGEDRDFFLSCLGKKELVRLIPEIGSIYHDTVNSLSKAAIEPNQDAFYQKWLRENFSRKYIYVLKRVYSLLKNMDIKTAYKWAKELH